MPSLVESCTQKSPKISGSFAENDLQLNKSDESLSPCKDDRG